MSMIRLENTVCTICDMDNSVSFMEVRNTHGSHRISDERFTLVKCKDCGLVYINPRPCQAEIQKYYDADYYGSDTGVKTFMGRVLSYYFLKRKKNLIMQFKRNGKILDIGCGDGRFISLFASDGGWAACGVEPHPAGCDLSRQRSKAMIFNMELAECRFRKDDFDVITLWHVLEHLYEPSRVLLEIRRILRDNGILIIGVPNAGSVGFILGKKNWFHLDAPRHLYHYDSRVIKRMLHKNGFDIIKIIYPITEYPLDLYHSLINSVGRGLGALLIMPLLGLSLLCKPFFSFLKISETMIVICRKGV